MEIGRLSDLRPLTGGSDFGLGKGRHQEAYIAGELLLQHLQLLDQPRGLRVPFLQRLELRAQVLRQLVRRLCRDREQSILCCSFEFYTAFWLPKTLNIITNDGTTQQKPLNMN